ncbi:MAG: hypothetical protein LBC29_06365 [Propionibacteriaceae bacterium]|nr:hypothetical protein [Propionibacteriaceae bacterium]
MTQENSPSEQSETSTEADVTLVPPVVDSAPQIPDAEPADSPASSDTELESLVVDSAAEVAPSDTPQPANPYTAPATESADAD